jgi:hypothetical protein
MIAAAVLNDICRLLAEDRLSQRKIAQRTGVSRGTVAAIAAGRRPKCPRRDPCDEFPLEPRGPLMRCPGCGGKAHMPCRFCYMQAVVARTRRPFRRDGDFPTDLNLNAAHQARYEKVLRRRRAAERAAERPKSRLPRLSESCFSVLVKAKVES